MLKDKEVVSDPQRQYEIARQIHAQQHGGINKTTATIALKYHWVRIKETVSMVIKNCPECKEAPKTPLNSSDALSSRKEKTQLNSRDRTFTLTPTNGFETPPDQLINNNQFEKDSQFTTAHPQMIHAPVDTMDYTDLPLDPQIMDDLQQHLPAFQHPDSVDPYGQNTLNEPHGLPHDFDGTQIHNHDQHNEYKVMVDEDEVMASQAAAALREQSFHLVDTSQLNNDPHLHHEILSAAFAGRDDGTQFDH